MTASRDRLQISRGEKRGRLASLVLVVVLVVVCGVILGLCLLDYDRLRAFEPEGGLVHVRAFTGLEFPGSTQLVDAYVWGGRRFFKLGFGMDTTINYYYRVEIRRSEIEEFTQQELVKGKWDLLQQSIGLRPAIRSVPRKLRKHWGEAAIGWNGPWWRVDTLPTYYCEVIVRLDTPGAPDVSTVYIIVFLSKG